MKKTKSVAPHAHNPIEKTDLLQALSKIPFAGLGLGSSFLVCLSLCFATGRAFASAQSKPTESGAAAANCELALAVVPAGRIQIDKDRWVYFEDYQPDGGVHAGTPTLVFLNGWVVRLSDYRKLYFQLKESGVRVVSIASSFHRESWGEPRERGETVFFEKEVRHLGSPLSHPRTLTVADMADEAEAVLKSLEVSDYTLMGHSAGSFTAVELASRSSTLESSHRPRNVILSAPAIRSLHHYNPMGSSLEKGFRWAGLNPILYPLVQFNRAATIAAMTESYLRANEFVYSLLPSLRRDPLTRKGLVAMGVSLRDENLVQRFRNDDQFSTPVSILVPSRQLSELTRDTLKAYQELPTYLQQELVTIPDRSHGFLNPMIYPDQSEVVEHILRLMNL